MENIKPCDKIKKKIKDIEERKVCFSGDSQRYRYRWLVEDLALMQKRCVSSLCPSKGCQSILKLHDNIYNQPSDIKENQDCNR